MRVREQEQASGKQTSTLLECGGDCRGIPSRRASELNSQTRMENRSQPAYKENEIVGRVDFGRLALSSPRKMAGGCILCPIVGVSGGGSEAESVGSSLS